MEVFSQLDALLKTQYLAKPSKFPNAASPLVELGTPSTSIAILDNGVIHSHCVSSVLDDESTLFQACSISKPITALAVFRLIDQGKLSLHASISNYLAPGEIEILETKETAGLAKYITISSLLSHTSGLGTHGFRGYSSQNSSDATYASGGEDLPSTSTVIAGELPTNTLPIILEDWPGHRFCYSGGGITVLQLILERIAGLPFETIILQNVFEPLDMRRSRYAPPSDEDINGLLDPQRQGKGNFSRAYYTGICPCEDPHRINPELAAAGLWTTPGDLLKAGRSIQMSLVGAPGAFLSMKSARVMLTEVQDSVAHGWFVPKEPFPMFMHAGSNMPGWECNLVCYTDFDLQNNESMTLLVKDTVRADILKNCGIAIMTNSEKGVTVYNKIMSAICYFKCWPLPSKPQASTHITVPFAVMDKIVDPTWVEWQGKWEGGWELLEKDGLPHMMFMEMPPVRLQSAAQPQETPGNLDLVAVGLEIMFRLRKESSTGSNDVSQTIEIWSGSRGDKHLIQRVK